jgi:hypothetical protein
MKRDYAKSGPEDLSCQLPGGRRLRMFDTVLGPPCSRCHKNVEDIAFLIEDQEGTGLGGGFCGSCLEEVFASACTSDPNPGAEG